jgi:hypothetical protein
MDLASRDFRLSGFLSHLSNTFIHLVQASICLVYQRIWQDILSVLCRYLTNATGILTTWNPYLWDPYTQIFHHAERMERKSIVTMFACRCKWQRHDNRHMAHSAIWHSMKKGPAIWHSMGKRPVIYLVYLRIHQVYTWLNPSIYFIHVYDSIYQVYTSILEYIYIYIYIYILMICQYMLVHTTGHCYHDKRAGLHNKRVGPHNKRQELPSYTMIYWELKIYTLNVDDIQSI